MRNQSVGKRSVHPETLEKEKAIEEAPIQEANNTRPPTLPKNNKANTGPRQEMQDLTTRVLKLLREENYEVKGSTELQLRHKIELELDLSSTKLRSCERTISRMSKRINELETKIWD
jgi:hypothetical protein